MAQLHLELSNMYSLDKLLSKEESVQKRMRIMSSMKSLMNEVMSSPYFTMEIVKQFPKWDWDLTRLAFSEKFDYDLLYTLSRYGKNWNSVLDILIRRKDFSMQIVKNHPSFKWENYGYLLMEVKDFTPAWKREYPDWTWKSQDELELMNKLSKMSMSIDSGLTGKLPIPFWLDESRAPSPANPARKRKRIDISPEREYLVLDSFNVEELTSNISKVYKTPESETQKPKLVIGGAPRKRVRKLSYEF